MELNIKDSKILIVDDIAENIQVLGSILGEKGYEITMAMDGQEALDSVEEDQPDLILLDINMPGMDGYEACKRLKENDITKSIPIIFLTANTEVEKVVKGFELGAVDYVTKPFQSKELLQRVKTHLELQKTKKELMESIDVKNKFFRIIAHDMKSPFNALIGFSNILLTSKDITDEQKDTFIQIINDASKSGLGLLENLLLWAESQTNAIKQNPENINLHLIAENVMQIQNLSASQKGIVIKNKIDDNLNVFADSHSVNTILRNLISNAIKFTPKGGEICLEASADSNEATIRVTDNGVGIKDYMKDDIFRTDKKTTTQGTEKESGTGIGLLLVKDFVEKNKGKVWVESEEGKGTIFSFTLPFTK